MTMTELQDIEFTLYPLNAIYDRVQLPESKEWDNISYFVIDKLDTLYPGKYQHYTYYKQDHALACYKYKVIENEIKLQA